MPQTLEALTVDKVASVKPVDPAKSYRVTLQIGASQRWRQFSGGKWREDRQAVVDEGERAFVHIPALHIQVGPFSGTIVNGLIQSHNDWINSNRAQQVGGGVERQLLVLEVQETDEIAPDQSAGNLATLLTSVIGVAVREAISAAFKEFTKK